MQGVRQIRFTSAKEIAELAPALRTCIQEAIAIEQAGMTVSLKKTAEFAMPQEFAATLKAIPALKKAFNALSPGRQRGYLLYFGGAKQSKTSEARIDKNVERLLAGKGLDDRPHRSALIPPATGWRTAPWSRSVANLPFLSGPAHAPEANPSPREGPFPKYRPPWPAPGRCVRGTYHQG